MPAATSFHVVTHRTQRVADSWSSARKGYSEDLPEGVLSRPIMIENTLDQERDSLYTHPQVRSISACAAFALPGAKESPAIDGVPERVRP